ncbi:CopD family protein [Brucella pituitosa]|uniref:CopD family protein n=1 Tax=Brucella pituitosa TaxID=571256 RepID=UPI002005410D|nr:CopD family protein [Brucella pituitosa]MCK4205102.1 CopD family protein [Brucella pituitosa]
MTGIDIVIALVRCLNFAGLAMLAGAMFFRILLVPSTISESKLAAFVRFWWLICGYSVAISAFGLVLWVPLQFSLLSGANSLFDAFAFLPSGLIGTAFGIASGLRALAIVLAALLLPYAIKSQAIRILLFLIAALALGLQIRMGHAAAADTIWLPLAVSAHVIAGALWFGSLLPLYLLLRVSRVEGLQAARRFSLFGIVFVAVLIVGATIAGWLLTGGLPGLVGTTYGRIMIIKVALLAAMLTLAALNRFWLSRDGSSGKGLRYALIFEATIGLMVFLAASLLATQPPGVHEDIIWPFAYRLRDNILGDAFLVDAAWRSFKPLLLALLIGIGCLFLPKWRWPAIIVVAVIGFALFQPPRIGLFVQDANEASFLRSPTSYTSIAIARGGAAFGGNCASCHGNDGRGRGEQATGDPVWPPDLTAPLFADRSDGELFWTIMQGKELKDGRQSMPGFGSALDAKTAWSIVDYIRMIASARTISLPAPDGEVYPAASPRITVYCDEERHDVGRQSDSFWLLHLQGEQLEAFAVHSNGMTIQCDVSDQTAALAVQLLTPTSRETSVLVDQNGWIRFRWSVREDLSFSTLAAAIQKARANPVSLLNKGHHS